jgi:hypothetical protein
MPRPSPKRVIHEPVYFPEYLIGEPAYQSQRSRRPSIRVEGRDRGRSPERPLSDYARYAGETRYARPYAGYGEIRSIDDAREIRYSRYTTPYVDSSPSSQEGKVLSPGPPQTHAAVPPPSPAPCEPLMPETENSRRVGCDICGGLEIEINRKRDWQLVQGQFFIARSDVLFRKHIFEDLRPYQCVEASCQSASETYSTCTKLLKHMKEQHPNSELLTVKELACPFCQEELPAKKQQRLKHVGGHMEEIALSAITGAFEEDWKFYSDSEKYLSSVCGQEPRQHKDPLESKNFPSLTSGLASAPEAPTVERAEAKTVPTIPRQESGGQSSEPAAANEKESLSFKPADEDKRGQRREARRASSANPVKVSASPTTTKPDALDMPSPSKSDKDPTSDDNPNQSSSKQRLSHATNNPNGFIQKLNQVLEDNSYSTMIRRQAQQLYEFCMTTKQAWFSQSTRQ